jgi:acyl-coenzyme A thioesterase PaaI-like protein
MDDIPEGYSHEESTSPFVNYIGPIFHRETVSPEGVRQFWRALRIKDHHLNTWNFGHGALMAGLAECGVGAAAYVAGGDPVIIVELQTYFIRAPKLGTLLETCGTLTRATRSMYFTQMVATADGEIVFTASGLHKRISGSAS